MAALILNRCSRSGIIAPNVGPIGGRAQTGKYAVADRFDPQRVADRLTYVASFSRSLRNRGRDGISYIRGLDGSVGIEDEVFLFVDPPYSDVGDRLYAHGMREVSHHKALADALHATPVAWAMTYDSTPSILSDWYPDERVLEYTIRHNANTGHDDTEYLIFGESCHVYPGDNLPLPGGAARWVQCPPDEW